MAIVCMMYLLRLGSNGQVTLLRSMGSGMEGRLTGGPDLGRDGGTQCGLRSAGSGRCLGSGYEEERCVSGHGG